MERVGGQAEQRAARVNQAVSRRRKVGPVSQAIAQNMRRARAESGWTQEQLAAATSKAAKRLNEPMGISRLVIVGIESGERPVRADELPLLCAALGLSLSELVEQPRDAEPAVRKAHAWAFRGGDAGGPPAQELTYQTLSDPALMAGYVWSLVEERVRQVSDERARAVFIENMARLVQPDA